MAEPRRRYVATPQQPIAQPLERDWLLPYNRRLRHLKGITIRNLVLSDPSNRRRSHPIDNEAVPTSLASPSKTQAQHQRRPLVHSKSSTDLRAIHEAQTEDEENGAIVVVERPEVPKPGTTKRPLAARLRRRSTLDWINASPRARQQKLEDTADKRLVDSFFTLHVDGLSDPIYVSEVATKTIHPTFRHFDLSALGHYVTRQLHLSVNVWATTEAIKEYQYLLELVVSLDKLQFLGKSLESIQAHLPANCVLFHIGGGIYTNSVDLRLPRPDGTAGSRPSIPRDCPTSSYDALMRLSTLGDCIQDALQTRERLEREITGLLDKHEGALQTIQSVPAAELNLGELNTSLSAQRKMVQMVELRRDELKLQLKLRKETMVQQRILQSQGEQQMSEDKILYQALKESLASTTNDVRMQRRRICETMSNVYPVEPVPRKALLFTIRGSYLPNSEFDNERNLNEEHIAAALGHVAHVVHHLSFYLATPLPYPIIPRCSLSTILDPISMTPTPASTAGTNLRLYPLYISGVPRFRFEYAVFLMNKNIEILLNGFGLKVIDLRQTLPNLKYLSYVLTAGDGELPARKAGGIRAFLKEDLSGLLTPAMSRTASSDSHSSWQGVNGKSNGTAVPANGHDVVAQKKELGKHVSLKPGYHTTPSATNTSTA